MLQIGSADMNERMTNMNLKRKWAAAASAVLVVGALSAGAAWAARDDAAAPAANAQTSQSTPAESNVLKQLHELRRAERAKLKAAEKALVEQAVTDGKLTREQADRMLKRIEHAGHPGRKAHKWANMTRDEVKARLDEAVKSGRMTQDKADHILERWTQRHAAPQGQKQ